jgi:hypothetical protein
LAGYEVSDMEPSSKRIHNGIRTSAVQEISLQNYLLLFF